LKCMANLHKTAFNTTEYSTAVLNTLGFTREIT